MKEFWIDLSIGGENSTTMGGYIFGSSVRELLRLELQAELFEAESTRTLELAGIKRGMRCIDFGCGNGYTSILLSKLVGEEGRVIGVDISKDALLAAEENAKKRGIKNIEFIQTSVYNSGLKDESYDLAYSRFLFTHLQEPRRAVEEMVRVVKPNGVVVAEDFNHELRITYPYNEYLEKLRVLLIELLKRNGSHEVAGMLYNIFKEAGLDANANLYGVCFPLNERYKIIPLLFVEVLKDRFIESNLIDEREYEEIVKGVKEYIEQDALVIYSSVFRVWGVKRPL